MAMPGDVFRKEVKCEGNGIALTIREFARLLKPWLDSSSGFVNRKAEVFYETETGDSAEPHGDEYVIAALGGLKVKEIAVSA